MNSVFELRKGIGKIMKLAGFRLSSWSKFFYISEQEKKVLPWFRDQGDKNLRLNYDLDENSMVFDLG